MAFDGPAAVSDPSNSEVTATTDQWSVDDAGIDQFELTASRRILATSAPHSTDRRCGI